MTNNELTWKLVERIEELALMQRPQLKSGPSPSELAQRAEMIVENDSLRRELSEVKAKHDILLHELNELNEAHERMSEMEVDSILAHDPPAKNEKLDAVVEKMRKVVVALNWVTDEGAVSWTLLSASDVSVMLSEAREAIGWVKP